MKATKRAVSKEDTFDLLDIRVGKVIKLEPEPSALKKSYRLTVDFGKFGIKTSVARLTQHSSEELLDQLVVAVLNFEPKQVGETISQVLVLGIQYPKADSGEATPITPMASSKIGGKLF